MSTIRTSVRLVSLVALIMAGTAVSAQAPSPVLLVLLNASPTSRLAKPPTEMSIGIVDVASGKVLGRIVTDEEPSGIAISPDSKIAYTAYSSGSLSVIDVATRKEIRRVDVGKENRPSRVYFSGGKVYFTAGGRKAVGRYDPASNKIDWVAPHGQSSNIMAVSSAGDRIFLSHRDSNSVSVIEGVKIDPSKATVTNIRVAGSAEGLDISPDGREVWAANRFGAGVSIIDVATKQVTNIKVAFETPKLGWKRRPHELGVDTSLATRLSFTRDGKVLLLNRPTAEVVILDGASRKELKRLQMAGDNMTVTPDGSRAFVSVEFPPAGDGDSYVAVIDMKTLTVTGRIPTGGRTTYLAYAGK